MCEDFLLRARFPTRIELKLLPAVVTGTWSCVDLYDSSVLTTESGGLTRLVLLTRKRAHTAEDTQHALAILQIHVEASAKCIRRRDASRFDMSRNCGSLHSERKASGAAFNRMRGVCVYVDVSCNRKSSIELCHGLLLGEISLNKVRNALILPLVFQRDSQITSQ
jgi:hypothetical protein